jgi:hypothetical protein
MYIFITKICRIVDFINFASFVINREGQEIYLTIS